MQRKQETSKLSVRKKKNPTQNHQIEWEKSKASRYLQQMLIFNTSMNATLTRLTVLRSIQQHLKETSTRSGSFNYGEGRYKAFEPILDDWEMN